MFEETGIIYIEKEKEKGRRAMIAALRYCKSIINTTAIRIV